jgi:hypothetical protein
MTTSRTLTRASSLEALSALDAAIRLAFDDQDVDRDRHGPLAKVWRQLSDELGVDPGMNLDDPEWVAMDDRSVELELEVRLGLPLA